MKLLLHTRYLLNFSVLLLFSFGLLSCKEDEGEETPEVDPLVGTYTFQSATFVNEITITLDGQETTFQAGADATTFVAVGLLREAPCDDPTNAALELRENGQGFFVCRDETNEEQAGTWEVNDARTQITLLITNPAPLTVLIEDFELSNNILSGRVSNFPLVRDNQYPIGSPLPGGGLNLQTTSVDIEFDKVE